MESIETHSDPHRTQNAQINISDGPTQPNTSSTRNFGRIKGPRRRNNDSQVNGGPRGTDVSQGPGNSSGNSSGNAPAARARRPANRNRPRIPRDNEEKAHVSPSNSPSGEQTVPTRNYLQRNQGGTDAVSTNASTSATSATSATNLPKRPGGYRRNAKFNASLTEPDAVDVFSGSGSTSRSTRPHERYRSKGTNSNNHAPDDLTSTLIRSLRTPPYPDCPICFSAIRPEQATWSCSPSIPVIVSHESETSQYCWTTFHIKCIKSWAGKSVKDVVDAWRARGEPDRKGDWRCPGCQSKREIVPSGYWCFCNSTPEPKTSRLATPHSCGGPCSRIRESGCGHPCPLPCHPGPCPPCQITTQLSCYCPRQKVTSFRCAVDKGKLKRDLSCGEVCGRSLNCGKHSCEKICHEGDCGSCLVILPGRCLCGKETKDVVCGQGIEVECRIEGQEPWVGMFTCDSLCDKVFDCGIHKCEKQCHSPSFKPSPCPRSPSSITHCPCGHSTIAPSPSSDQSQYDFPARTRCTSPIPTCSSSCSKPHLTCSHACSHTCHSGPCPPCSVKITRPCRCGQSTKSFSCYELYDVSGAEKEVLCDRPCPALRACGRHQCRRLCCPLASLAYVAKKGRKKVFDSNGPFLGEERGGLHECDLVCDKVLSCGNHRCEEKDHKGPCPPCLRSSFEEFICFCGRTVLEPPIPCGTEIQCSYPCPRPPPSCGHSRTPHSCHEEPSPCPPCAHLATKQCACGKKMVQHVRCSLETEKVSCGTVCGRLMPCGFHHCERLCHAGDCGSCTASCGKSRKLCQPNSHPCTQACHAPSACPETEPCQSLITLTCPCGRIRQNVSCGKCTANPIGQQKMSINCSNECNIAKRNAKLAAALGIDPEAKSKAVSVVYPDELTSFARVNIKFVPVVEKAFADFITSDKRTQVLPHMPQDRRKFVHDLASIYRMDTQMVDQEPHRSVQLLRRVDSRIPQPLLSNYISNSAMQSSLGRLADLRGVQGGQSLSWRQQPSSSSMKPATPANSWTAGWTGTSQQRYQNSWTAALSKPSISVDPVIHIPSAPGSSLGIGSRGPTRTPTPTGIGGSQPGRRAITPTFEPRRSVTPTPAFAPGEHIGEHVPENWEDDV